MFQKQYFYLTFRNVLSFLFSFDQLSFLALDGWGVVLLFRLSHLLLPRRLTRLFVSPRSEWWFRVYCEVGNPIQSRPRSKGGESLMGWGEGVGGCLEVQRWATGGIMGVIIAVSVLSAAPGALATYLSPSSLVALSIAAVFSPSLSSFLTPLWLFSITLWTHLSFFFSKCTTPAPSVSLLSM